MMICLVILNGASNKASAQEVSARQKFIRKGTTELVIGGVVAVGGVIGLKHSAKTIDFNQDIGSQAGGSLVWSMAVITGSAVGVTGIVHLVKGKRMVPAVSKQYIPGLDHMGIVYPKYPTIGVKYRL